MRGIRTLSPLASSVKIAVFTICLPSSVIHNRVPLHNLGASNLRINKTGTPALNSNLCDDTSNNFKEFRNSRDSSQYHRMTSLCRRSYTLMFH
ncbi:uncharacterized protein TNCT_589721 [Trichonephila clavata]|uniref:Uncharacterized protein n=1 Tax=Trichonephila clavata TaxID=2740835 RepID=A0A8X6KYN4_TRICU|nr:uncharacterized protein TNCT_589721 [Trichonephila clavata]